MKALLISTILVQCLCSNLQGQSKHPYLALSNRTQEVVNQYLDIVKNGDYDRLMSVLTDSTTLIDYNSLEIPGYKGSWTGSEIGQMMKDVSGKLTDKTETVISTFTSGSYCVINFESMYNQKQGGKVVRHQAKGVKVFHVIRGRIIKIDEYLDYDALLRQNMGIDKE
jgi:ketosteroid isomerase-like protein